MLLNEDLWFVREDERVVFETTQAMHMAEEPSGGRDVVQDFAVFIPSTNFLPALDYLKSGFIMVGREIEIADVEFMYDYFVRVPFANGTTREVSTGFTGFHPLYDPADTPRMQSSETIRLEPWQVPAPRKDSLITNYTAQVSGLVFTEGFNDQVVTVTIARTGPARTFTAPLTIRGCVEPTFSSKWAIEHDMPGSQPMYRPEYVLRSTLEDIQDANRNPRKQPCFGRDRGTSITKPNSTFDEVQSHDIVTTTSAAVTIPIEVNRRQITNFETYYQTLANFLRIILETPRTENEIVDPDGPPAEVSSIWSPEIADDEEPWVPWEKKAASEKSRRRVWGRYSGRVPAVVRPIGEVTPSRRCLHAGVDTSSQVVVSGGTRCEQHPLIHYLDERARGPTFVDSSTADELLAEDPAERELRAPVLEPVVSSPPEGEELIHRYYHYPHKPLIYVGETWVKKSQRQVTSTMSRP